MKSILIILAVFALMQLCSCSTPLDLNTQRIDSLLTPSFRLRTLTTSVWSGDSTLDTLAIAHWQFVQDTLYFHTSHSESPPRLTMYAHLLDDPTADTTSALILHELDIRLVDVPTNDTTHVERIAGSPDASGMYAQANFVGQQKTYLTNDLTRNFHAVVDLHYVDSAEKKIQGTITLVVNSNATTYIKIITAIEGEE